MKYRNIELPTYNDAIKFTDKINVISIDNDFVFDIIAIPMIHICLTKKKFMFSCSNSIYTFENKIVLDFELKNKQKRKIDFFIESNGRPTNMWMVEHKGKLFKEIVNEEENQPILLYFKRDSRFSSSAYDMNNVNEEINNLYLFEHNFGGYDFYFENQFFANLAVKDKFLKNDEYASCHFNNLKSIIDNFLHVNYYDNFSFNTNIGKFVYHEGGLAREICHSPYDIGSTCGMIMKIYCECLKRKKENFIGNPCDEDGIVICNYNFGERPSYSDKKWEYYNIFSEAFPNIQFICC